MPYKGRVILILGITGAVYLLLSWFAFHPELLKWNAKPIIIAIFVLSIAPIYPLFRIAKKRDGVSALAISLLIGGMIFGIAYLVGGAILHTNALWPNTASTISESLIIASCLIFIFNGVVRHSRH